MKARQKKVPETELRATGRYLDSCNSAQTQHSLKMSLSQGRRAVQWDFEEQAHLKPIRSKSAVLVFLFVGADMALYILCNLYGA